MYFASSACFLINKPSGFGAPSRGMGAQLPHGHAFDFCKAAACIKCVALEAGSGFLITCL